MNGEKKDCDIGVVFCFRCELGSGKESKSPVARDHLRP